MLNSDSRASSSRGPSSTAIGAASKRPCCRRREGTKTKKKIRTKAVVVVTVMSKSRKCERDSKLYEGVVVQLP
jgi:hypothetical protein